jgi:hypothetical protein
MWRAVIGVLAVAASVIVGCEGAAHPATAGANLRAGSAEALSWSGSSAEPVPVPGTTVFGPGLPPEHVFAPGPPPAYAGLNVEPSTITNFKGLSMISEDYTLTATAEGSDGTNYLVGTDMRVFRGQYRTPSGDHHATFCFI